MCNYLKVFKNAFYLIYPIRSVVWKGVCVHVCVHKCTYACVNTAIMMTMQPWTGRFGYNYYNAMTL